jgi:hypothetical protein
VSGKSKETLGGQRKGKTSDWPGDGGKGILVFKTGQTPAVPFAEDYSAMEMPHQENRNDELPAVPE